MSGNTGFRFAYNLAGRTSGIIRSFIIANSATITIGDMVSLSSGYVALSGAGATIFGVVVGVVDKNGINMDNSRLTLTGSGASWTSSTHTFVAGSDNTSTDYVRALIDCDPFSVWSAVPDATIGSTTGSNLAGYYCDIPSASDQPDESSTLGTQCQLFIWGVDPSDSTRGLYSIAQHQLWGWTIV